MSWIDEFEEQEARCNECGRTFSVDEPLLFIILRHKLRHDNVVSSQGKIFCCPDHMVDYMRNAADWAPLLKAIFPRGDDVYES
jgi:hypothetical protein